MKKAFVLKKLWMPIYMELNLIITLGIRITKRILLKYTYYELNLLLLNSQIIMNQGYYTE